MPMNFMENTEIYEIITDAMKKSKARRVGKVRVGFSLVAIGVRFAKYSQCSLPHV